MSKLKKKRNDTRQAFLLTFFDKKIGYEARDVNGFTLVKQFNKTSNRWEVAIWDSKTYKYIQQDVLPFFKKQEITKSISNQPCP